MPLNSPNDYVKLQVQSMQFSFYRQFLQFLQKKHNYIVIVSYYLVNTRTFSLRPKSIILVGISFVIKW